MGTIRFCYHSHPLRAATVAYAKLNIHDTSVKEAGGCFAVIRKLAAELFPSLPDDVIYTWVDKNYSKFTLRTDENVKVADTLTSKNVFTVHIKRPFTLPTALSSVMCMVSFIMVAVCVISEHYFLALAYCFIFVCVSLVSQQQPVESPVAPLVAPLVYKYQAQLDMMNSMGFNTKTACYALGRTDGKLDDAIYIASQQMNAK